MSKGPKRRRRSFFWPLVIVLGAVLVFTAGIVVGTSPIQPANWRPAPAPALERELTPNGALAAMDRLSVDGTAPEDVEVMPDGTLVAGVDDGRLLRGDWDAGMRTWARLPGRPLGMEIAPNGDLIVAVAERGLVRVDPAGEVHDVLTTLGGAPLRFPDDVAVAADGTIYFTVASDRHPYAEWEYDIIENSGNGALYRLTPAGDVQTLLQNLYFANGVVLAEDESYALVVESARYRVRRVWLSGPRAPGSELLLDNLPGFPDGVARSDDGTFWVTIAAPREPVLDWTAPFGLARHLVAALPESVRPGPKPLAHVINFDADGRILESLDDRSDGAFRAITNVVEHDGVLYFGSLIEGAIGRYRCGCSADDDDAAQPDGTPVEGSGAPEGDGEQAAAAEAAAAAADDDSGKVEAASE